MGAVSHGDLVVRHGHPFDLLSGWVSGDTVSHVLLVLADQLSEHVLGELSQDELLHLNLFPLPLLVELSDVLPMAQLVRPVDLDPDGCIEVGFIFKYLPNYL